MFTAKEYIKVKSFEEAYALNQKKRAMIIGGNMMTRLGHRKLDTVIDLSALDAEYIIETKNEFKIGCMCSLRDLEKNKAFSDYFGDALENALSHIVGVQFRNCATVGGSIFGRFGFSDVLTYFLCLDTYVNLYEKGLIPLKDFILESPGNDVLTEIIVKKDGRKVFYDSLRLTETDFPVITTALSFDSEKRYFSIGARPSRANLVTVGFDEFPEKLSKKEILSLAEKVSESFSYGSNMRAGREYRKHIAKVLTARLLEKTGCEMP